MSGTSGRNEIGLEVRAPDRTCRFVPIAESPFLIGRGTESGKHLQLTEPRISRHCAAINMEGGEYYLEDRGQRSGLFVNGERITRCRLQLGDVITFGFDNFYELTFRTSEPDTTIPDLLNTIEGLSASDTSPGGLRKLNLLLEATALLHSRLPLDAVLGNVVDHAITITSADRGLLLEANASGQLKARLARRSGGRQLPSDQIAPSQTALRMALEQRSSVITGDLAQSGLDLRQAPSVAGQRLRAIVVIPLYAIVRASTNESAVHNERGELLGVIYLDSSRPAAPSSLDRKILDALGVEAASILENARLVERDRERRRLEQEIEIAREIQRALLPRSFRDFPHMDASGINLPCLSIGGDYFDVFSIDASRTAFLIADVAGKGHGAALLAAMLRGALLGITIGAHPARVIDHINQFFCMHPEVERYATVFVGILSGDGQIEFVNAGHPSPILLRCGKVLEPFTEGSFPVGMMPGATYRASRAQLEPGDTLVLYSDGVTEAMSTGQQLFGAARLREVLLGKHDTPLESLQSMVLESVQTFAHGAGQADDITLLLIRYSPTNFSHPQRP
ncbi:MAG TPA: SpoIIE family protein phosphatase [Candidatus Acidoferrales bacterium]|nr:SpoIIE family protein phosphatase [Candidatus Acidoferrales bacterium]